MNYIQTIRVQIISSHCRNLALCNEESWSLLRIMILEINYHPREANVVIDAWSQRSHLSQLEVEIIDRSTLGLLLI
jgi:hypothetical protein